MASLPARPGLPTILREWGRVGCLGFGGPPAHIAMLRELCVARRGWIDATEFEHAIAVTNLLPGPASTQLAIFTAWRMGGMPGALVGGLAFVGPGLVVMLALAALFLASSPPDWVVGAGAGAGGAVAAVALHAGWGLVGPSLARAGARRVRWALELLAGILAAILLGPWLVLVLFACGLAEVLIARAAVAGRAPLGALVPLPLLVGAAKVGGLGALSWVGFKVGALSYGGGFVIIPLMQHDAVESFHWMSDAQFLNAVALGQVTPGPVTHTVAAVGYAAHGVGGALLATAVAFAPSFVFVLAGGPRFEALRHSPTVQAFLSGAGPAAIGGILGSAVPLARALSVWWQWPVLAGAVVLLLVLRRGVVTTLVAAGLVGVVVALAGGPLS